MGEEQRRVPQVDPKIADKGDGVAVRLVVDGDTPREAAGVVRVLHWTDAERTTRAIQRLALFWGGALVSIAIPFLHFCLVPGLFAVGPFVAWWVHRQASVVLGGAGSCPACGDALVIERMPEEWPLQVQCGGCRAWSSVERAPA